MSKYKKCPVCPKCHEPYIPGNIVCECPDQKALVKWDSRIELLVAEHQRAEIVEIKTKMARMELRCKLAKLAEENGYLFDYYWHNDPVVERQIFERLDPYEKYLNMKPSAAHARLVNMAKNFTTELDRIAAEG